MTVKFSLSLSVFNCLTLFISKEKNIYKDFTQRRKWERESRRVIESNVESCELRFEILINVKIYSGRRNELYLFLLFFCYNTLSILILNICLHKNCSMLLLLFSYAFLHLCFLRFASHTLLLHITWNISRAKKNTVKRGITVFF